MSEEENTCKISIPLISDYEIRQIDNYFDDIVHQFTKQLVHDKDLAIAQHIIQKQQEEIELLKEQKQYVIDEYSETIEKKDKIIDEMAGYIATLDIEEDICSKTENEHCDKMNFGECEDCIKQYFESKV